jgi:hypothetical protein
MKELEQVRSFLFVNGVKNSVNNKDGDNSFYYCGVAVSKKFTLLLIIYLMDSMRKSTISYQL